MAAPAGVLGLHQFHGILWQMSVPPWIQPHPAEVKHSDAFPKFLFTRKSSPVSWHVGSKNCRTVLIQFNEPLTGHLAFTCAFYSMCRHPFTSLATKYS